jgi:secreted PhoX family phosphatase
MNKIDHEELSFDDWDERHFPRPEVQDFDRVVERAISRRGFLGGALAFGSGAAVMGTSFLKGSTAMAAQSSRFAFDQLAPQTDGTVHVPEGYEWEVLVRWGDPLFGDAPAWDAATASLPRARTGSLARTPTAWSFSTRATPSFWW